MIQEEEALMAEHAERIANLEHAYAMKELFKRRYRRACWKANRKARKAAEAEVQVVEPDVIELAEGELEDYVEARNAQHSSLEEARTVEPIDYQEAARQAWQSQNTNFYSAKKVFRRFAVKDGKANFQVAKDGACYEGLGLDVDGLSVAELKRWASVLQAPYASKLRRAELEYVLAPVLLVLAVGTMARW
jgi:hypothetical protein